MLQGCNPNLLSPLKDAYSSCVSFLGRVEGIHFLSQKDVLNLIIFKFTLAKEKAALCILHSHLMIT